jgi:diguanylate cyclase (GGDEF)-like protein
MSKKKTISIKTFLVILAMLLIAFWSYVIVVDVNHAHDMYQELALEMALAYSKSISDIREWAARHDGVYAPISETTKPNLYLDIVDREIRTDSGLELTKLNPAYIARQVSDITQENYGVKFDIISQYPANPSNIADEWEANALENFRQAPGTDNIFDIVKIDGESKFRYITPIYVESECTTCHVEEGYEIGELRGGISIRFPYAPYEEGRIKHVRHNMSIYIMSFLTSMLFIIYFGRKLILANESNDKLYNKLEQIAHTDKLTQLPNRYYFMKWLEIELQRYIKHKTKLALLMIDLNKFKAINDTYGHIAGDLVLKKAGEVIAASIRATDLCGRIGGDEFVVMLTDTNEEAAVAYAERLREAFDQAYIIYDDVKIQLSASIGVAPLVGIDNSFQLSENVTEANITTLRDQLIKQSDKAMYQAKEMHKQKGGSHIAVTNHVD